MATINSKIFLLFLSIIFVFGCKQKNKLQEGDILFQDLNCGPLCNAIEAVTEGVNGRDFSHCAIVVKENDSLKVLEAIGSKVHTTSIKDFLARSNDTATINNIVVERLKPAYKNLIPTAIAFANQQIGVPYDDVFLLNNQKYYCSELLYEAFKNANGNKDFFQLYPMTYKQPNTDSFFAAWIDYYKDLNASIPEGKPGLNPGSISRDEKLEVVEGIKW